MSIAEPPSAPPPPAAPATLLVDRAGYLRLLVKASRSDPADWPAGYEQGAALVTRIREIELNCVAQHGKWEIDLLGEALETEYESCIAQLEDLIEPPDLAGALPAEQVYAELGIIPQAR